MGSDPSFARYLGGLAPDQGLLTSVVVEGEIRFDIGGWTEACARVVHARSGHDARCRPQGDGRYSAAVMNATGWVSRLTCGDWQTTP
jgi:hypothetical protein